MSIESEINRISTNVSDTLSAISEMGGTVSEDATSDDMAAGVRSIPVGATIDDTTASTTTTYSSQKIESTVNALKDDMAAYWQTVYPVGSIYMSVNSTSPASLLGGTWEQLKDRFLLGAGGSYTTGSTGGEATHTLTVAEMPSHRHIIPTGDTGGSYTTTGYETKGNGYYAKGESSLSAAETGMTGGGAAHNNMPPYIAVYMWKRVS